jgi:hypothetical protein
VYITFKHVIMKEDGMTSPPRDAPFYLVFEVRTDGGPHPQAWSRLPGIGSFLNSNQGRSLAARIEWEYPPNSGKWRFSYMQQTNLNVMADKNVPGSFVGLAKTISFIQWLADAKPNHNHSWIPHMTGNARVLQASWDLHNQTVEIGPQKPITMHSGARRTVDNIVADMRAPELKLANVNGPFGDFTVPGQIVSKRRKLCDFCSLVATKPGGECVPMKTNDRCCPSCWLFGRPCCSWTVNDAIRVPATFKAAASDVSVTRSNIKVTPEDFALNKKICAALVAQPSWIDTGVDQGFRPTIAVLGLAKDKDDLPEDDDLEEGEGKGEASGDEEGMSSDEEG